MIDFAPVCVHACMRARAGEPARIVLRGFMFALLLGIAFGTYSSIFIASAIAYDFLKGKGGKEEKLHGRTSIDAEIVEKK